MNILHTVEFYHPSQGGAQEVVKQLSERLVKKGHHVTVATSKLKNRTEYELNGVKIEEFDIQGKEATGISGEAGRYQDFLRDSHFDIIMNYAAQQWATDLIFPIIKEIPGKKILVPCGFSGLYESEYSTYYVNLKKVILSYDACVFLSNNYRDIDFVRKIGFLNIHVIPNGAARDEFCREKDCKIRQKVGIKNNTRIVLHVGSHTGLKGHRETIEIFQRANIRDTTLVIIGNSFGGSCLRKCRTKMILNNLNPRSLIVQGKKILVLSLSRKDTVNMYHEADLFLFPSNIECSPIVLFECMASKTPFLVTDVGNSSEIIEWSKAGVLLPTSIDKEGYSLADINDSVKMFEEIMSDEMKRNQLAMQGYNAWLERFTWEKIADQYEDLYHNLISH